MQDHNSPDNYPTDDNNDNNYSNNDNNYSTDDNNNNLAWDQYFIFRNQFDASKGNSFRVRPVRAF